MTVTKNFTPIPKLNPGDQVAVLSPSAGLPGAFPWVQDLGLQRLETVFGLKPKEYPTTRKMNAPLKDRARDVMAAFSDRSNKAVFTPIGGMDQIKLLKYLDRSVFQRNPKPFFGFSDNTHLHNYLWNLGIPSYYGGGIMTQFAMQKAMHEQTVESLRHALFETGEYEISAASKYNDEGLDWSDPKNLDRPRKMERNDGWHWDGAKNANGILWGGCVESLIVQVAAETYLPPAKDLRGCVLFLETAEDIPPHWVIEYLLTGFGERGWLQEFSAVLVGRPKAWEFDNQKTATEKAAYRAEQRETVLRVVREYNPRIPVVQNVDFGHTDPQLILPMGRTARLDSAGQRITLSY